MVDNFQDLGRRVDAGVNEVVAPVFERNGPTVVIYPRGFINAHTVRLFETEIQKAIEQKQFRIVVNCAGLSYIASAGLGAMMGAIEEIRDNGGDLRLTELNETVLNIFEILPGIIQGFWI